MVVMILALLIVVVAVTPYAVAADSLCATVKIEINQELTLERQGFEAHMRINNGFEHVALTNVDIDVAFSDENGNSVIATSDPANTNALFYISIKSMSNIDGIDGLGAVQSSTSADIRWLIIPAPGAAAENPLGMLYYVGATFRYRLGDTDREITVIPDYIYVKPMPDLVLDYFLPGDVYGDDSFTGKVEPPVPFSVGVRVKNIGYGTARNVQLDTGQPEIVDNDTGLLVAFIIRSCEVNGREKGNSLLIDLDDIAAGDAGQGRWIMTSSLSGMFTNFDASFSHSDELGGQLTSLVSATNIHSHTLVHDVLVDFSGSDSVRDFLVTQNIVYESDGRESSVSNVSSDAVLMSASGNYIMGISNVTRGPIYVQLPNPEGTNMVLQAVVRSDGKHLSGHNYWLSRKRKPNPEDGWDDYFNLFDVDASNYTYSATYQSDVAVNDAPVLSYVGPRSGRTDTYVGFAVYATDADGTRPALAAGTLPAGASFIDNKDGTGSFGWIPTAYQAGAYRIKFIANDGELGDCETITVTVGAEAVNPWPGWWDRRGVLDYHVSGTNDYAAVNQGQVKHMASMAWDELNALPGGPGFTLSFTNPADYAVVNIGQLKDLASLFYVRLSLEYPWAEVSGTNDHAIANIGQAKNVFCFDPTGDSDGDGMPDWWEDKYSPTLDKNDKRDAALDPDGDKDTNLYEYLSNTDPTVAK